MNPIKKFFIVVLVTAITGCTSTQAASPVYTSTQRISSSETPLFTAAPKSLSTLTAETSTITKTIQPIAPEKSPSSTLKPTRTATPTPTLGPDGWKSLPIIPTISDHVLEIYKHGQEFGNRPNAFSKIGDCGSTPTWFLGDFDLGKEFYTLGPYDHLEKVIQVFQGSFGRTSLAARSGFNASSLFVTLWSDRTYCEVNETPLECEYRVHQPSIAFIMLGTNDVFHPDEFEPQMRKIIEFTIEKGIIPVLSTKGDNEEGDGSINATIAQLSREYDIPLWNFWLAIHYLPNHGLQEDNVHLTWGKNFFDDPEAMSKAWPIRNLTALLVLEAVWQKITNP